MAHCGAIQAFLDMSSVDSCAEVVESLVLFTASCTLRNAEGLCSVGQPATGNATQLGLRLLALGAVA